MKVLVTGCGGYIGTVLTPYLLRRGYAVRCVDWLAFGEDVIAHVMGEKGFELVRADVRRLDYSAVLSGVDAVVDLAAISNDPAGELDPSLTLSINYEARARLAAAAKERGVGTYVLASSCSVYGRKEGIVDETAEPSPLTTYARANLLAERDVLPLADKKFSAVALRFATVYGPSRRMRFDLVVNAMTLTAYTEGRIYVEGDGMQMRPLVHVGDVVRAIAFAIEKADEMSGGVYNVGGENYRIRDLAEEVRRVVGGEIIYRGEIDRRSYAVSFDRIRKLGFQTLYTVPEGIKQVHHELLLGHLRREDRWFTVNWYKKLLAEGALR